MAKQLGGFDSWLIGVSAMIGAGLFAVFAPAYGLVGGWLWVAVLLAGGIAALNATSVAWLARRFPVSGAGYRYSTEVLGRTAGFATGMAFLIGKSGSVAAAALVISGAVGFMAGEWVAIAVIAMAVLLNFFGIPATAKTVRYLAIPSLLVLVTLLVALQYVAPAEQIGVEVANQDVSPANLFAAAGVMFFAFAGYARIATLAGEVSKPERTVPRAMLTALAAVLLVYLGFALTLPKVLGARLSDSPNALLAAAIELGDPWPTLLGTLIVFTAGAALLVLLAGISRTSEVMARDGELPQIFTRKSRFGSPWLAELVFGGLAVLIAVSGQVVVAISISAVLVLVYYGFAHLTVLRKAKSWSARLVALFGLLLCLAASLTLDPLVVLFCLTALAAAVLVRIAIAKLRSVE